MTWVFAIPVMAFLVLLVVGALTHRVTVRSCCAVADPRADLRMREAFLDDDPASAAAPRGDADS